MARDALLVLVGLVIGVTALVDPLIAWIAAHVPSWLEVIASWILRIIVIAGVGMAAMVVFVGAAGMIAGPFNEMLSAAVEEELTGKAGPPFSFRAFVRDALVGAVVRNHAVHLVLHRGHTAKSKLVHRYRLHGAQVKALVEMPHS